MMPGRREGGFEIVAVLRDKILKTVKVGKISILDKPEQNIYSLFRHFFQHLHPDNEIVPAGGTGG